jgi:hypothetical protein
LAGLVSVFLALYLMLSPKLLAGFKAKSRAVATVPLPLAELRNQLINRIDEYWRYFCNPADYSYVEKRIDPETGKVTEVFTPGRWKDAHHIVRLEEGNVVISIEWEGRLLPLTKKGDQELVLGVTTRDLIEQVLAEIKHSIKTGRMDEFLVKDRADYSLVERLNRPPSIS